MYVELYTLNLFLCTLNVSSFIIVFSQPCVYILLYVAVFILLLLIQLFPYLVKRSTEK
jgi:hypothetical protein